jgi:hypothetical protein
MQRSTLNLVGVSTLVVVPRIRSSEYLSMLASVAPGLAATRPGDNIEVEELPTLRRILLVDDPASSTHSDSAIRSLVDFRDVFMWGSGKSEEREMRALEHSLDRHDVINLQFTR